MYLFLTHNAKVYQMLNGMVLNAFAQTDLLFKTKIVFVKAYSWMDTAINVILSLTHNGQIICANATKDIMKI